MLERHQDYLKFRQEFPTFEYKQFQHQIKADGLHFSFHFVLGDKYHFHPSLHLLQHPTLKPDSISNELLNTLAFHLGMIELISYWKIACPPVVIISPYALDSWQQKWWKNLYFNGLGEFFYLNNIHTTVDDFMTFKAHGEPLPHPIVPDPIQATLVPVGGGKDSIVTLELLKAAGIKITPLLMNARGAMVNTLSGATIDRSESVEIKRTLDPLMLQLNNQGYLNGHTPFSAMLAFSTIMTAIVTQHNTIALSNEASANEATVLNSNINHQYSKSFDFEEDFRTYISKYITTKHSYFSFLRPLSELQIARIFSRFTQHHSTFRSCNAGSKTDSWCGHCPKCLFTAIILSAFLPPKQIINIFKQDIFNDSTLINIFDELCGLTKAKPFECVGTVQEVNQALIMACKKYFLNNPPLLIRHYLTTQAYQQFKNATPPNQTSLETPHALKEPFLSIIKEAICRNS